jgi:hypothetical protein
MDLYLFKLITPLAFFKDSSDSSEVIWNKLQTMSGSVVLPDTLIPSLLTFNDINDPASAKHVDPAELSLNFGPGYKFAGAKIELTKDSVTCGLKKKLPWWDGFGRPASIAIHSWQNQAELAGIKIRGGAESELLFTWCKS